MPSTIFAISEIRRVLKRLERDCVCPARILEETISFIDGLAMRHTDLNDPLNQFVFKLPRGALEIAIYELILPSDTAVTITQLRDRYDALRDQKGLEIVNENYIEAAHCRDEQYRIVAEIEKLHDGQVEVGPEHLISALRGLGFKAELFA